MEDQNMETNSADKSQKCILNFDEVRALLPHNEPFIFVDKVIDFEINKRIICLKNISGNDPWFKGHFPEKAIMPGVLLLESIAQSSLILAIMSNPDLKSKLAVLGSVKGRFLKPVFPGDQVIINVEIIKMISSGCMVSAKCFVNSEIVVNNVEITFGIIDKA